MKLAIFGKTPQSKKQLKKETERFGFAYAEKKPDVVISYGGDGTFLRAERAYPGIPKALFRFSKICKKCHNLPIDHALELLEKGKYRVQKNFMLNATIGRKKLTAVNDITIRNAEPTRAIRFTLAVNGKKLPHEYIGDGIVASTPHGSSGYFHSITRKNFSSGIGVALNNTTVKHAPLLLREKDIVVFTLTRGLAHVCADNNPDITTLKEGNTVRILKSRQKSKIITFGKNIK